MKFCMATPILRSRIDQPVLNVAHSFSSAQGHSRFGWPPPSFHKRGRQDGSPAQVVMTSNVQDQIGDAVVRLHGGKKRLPIREIAALKN
jgi:hypothetical protein